MKKFNKYILNADIKAQQVDLIDDNGVRLGTMSLTDALKLGEEKDLDIVQIHSQGAYPICKIMNYNKFLYKQKLSNRKNKKAPDTKELKLSLNIGENDYQVRKKQAIKFISNGHVVKFSIYLRGREQVFHSKAEDVLKRLESEIIEYASVKQKITTQGKEVSLIMTKK